ncbi:MAG TPA: trigger factor [Melioribacteraceae bacterium]|nr:trigger factor [Melioribacteraceae bacterium]
MEIKVNQVSDSKQEVEVNLTYEEITSDIEEAYSEERKNIEIDGFRKGKAPMAMIKKLYGEAIEYKASEKIATKKFWDVVDQENLKPISTPQLTDIDFVPGSKLFFKIQYEIKPKLELKNYKDLVIEKPLFKLKEEDIDKEVDYLLKPHFTFETYDVVEGKTFRITVNLQKLDENGVAVIGQGSENMLIDLSDEKVNQQIVENANGKKVSDKFVFTFVDEHYHGEELHREEYRYEAEITKIEKIVYPELTEEILKKISGNKAATLDEFKDMLRKNFTEYYTKQSEEIYTNSLLNEIVKNNEFTPPPGYVSSVHKRLIEMEKENAKRYKMPNVDEKAIAEYYKPRAEWNAKWQIILENLAETESIKVEESELEELANKEAEKTGISAQKLLKYYKDSNRGDVLLEDKVIDFLKANNKIKEVDAEEKTKEKKGK